MKHKNMEEYISKFKNRDLSWSSISSFEYDKENWYNKYILGKEQDENEEMKFGKKFAKSIEDGTCEVKELLEKLQNKKEHKFKVVFNNIPMVGYTDAFCDKTFTKLDEVKTSKTMWTQNKVDTHGQLDMYCLMNYITNKIIPNDVDITLYCLKTVQNGDFSIELAKPIDMQIFKTKRTMMDIIKFGQRINNTYKEMLEYIITHS